MSKSRCLYGFKNKETGKFMSTYWQHCDKIAFFRRKFNAEKAFYFLENKDKKLYTIETVCEIE